MDCQFLQDRIAATKALILVYEEAFSALAHGGISSYIIDTGQTKQTVTKANIATFSNTLDSLYNRLATMEARAGCGGSTYVRPIQ